MNENETELLCIGNAIVDVFARDGNGLALRYGLSEPVQHVEIEKLRSLISKLGETAAVSGGGTANAAKIAGLLGAKAGFSGAIGDDRYGRLFGDELKSAGVRTLLVEKRSPTGICLVLQTGDDTLIAASPSAALEFSEDDINEEEIKKAKVVVIDGFMLGRHDLVRRILALAAQHGTAVAIDLGSPAIAAEEAGEIAAYVASLDVASLDAAQDGVSPNGQRRPFFLFMNEDEAAAFYEQGWPGLGANDMSMYDLFNSLTQTMPYLIIVVKMGKRGAICFATGKAYNAGTEAVEPLETTGAGDAFCGAFLTAWARGQSLPECADLGNKAARIVLGGAGTKVDKNAFKKLAVFLKESAVS